MVVTKRIGKAPASNKPPPPDPTPSEFEFPFQFTVQGREIFVSVPKPDKITIIGDLLQAHFDPECSWMPLDYGPRVMSAISTGAVGAVKTTKYYSETYWGVLLHLPSGAAVDFKLAKSKSKNAVHTLRWEFNPARVGPEGMFNLLEDIHNATNSTFFVGAFLSTARVSRLDVAIDIVGLSVPELIVTAKGEGKRVRYVGADGLLETEYIHRAKKDPKTPKSDADTKPKASVGMLLARVYDRVRERSDAGLPPPYGPAPVTRIEISKVRFGNKPLRVTSLGSLPNLFAALRVGHIHSPAGNTWSWLEYLTARRGGGANWASQVLGLSAVRAKAMETAYLNHPSDVVDPKAAWSHWGRGLELTGTDFLIVAAEAKSKKAYLGTHPVSETDVGNKQS